MGDGGGQNITGAQNPLSQHDRTGGSSRKLRNADARQLLFRSKIRCGKAVGSVALHFQRSGAQRHGAYAQNPQKGTKHTFVFH